MTGVSILLVDDHPVVREGYRRLIERKPGLVVAAEAATAAEAYRAYRAVAPDVVVMDLTLPGPGGIEAIRHIRQWDRAARILVFSMHQAAAFAEKALEAGAMGYVTKTSDPDVLVRAIATVARGGRAFSDDIAAAIAAEAPTGVEGLGPRETEILRMLAEGMTGEEIATALCLSVKTVQNYQSQIKAKIGARTGPDLARLALAAGLLQR